MASEMTTNERKLRRCVMPSCQGDRFDLVHKFPMDNKRAAEWCRIVNVPELKNLTMDQLRKRCFVCSKHFRKEDYKNCESRSLNKTAYPSLFLNCGDSSVSTEGLVFVKPVHNETLPETTPNVESQINLNDLQSSMPSFEQIRNHMVFGMENLTAAIPSEALLRAQNQPDLSIPDAGCVMNENITSLLIGAMLASPSIVPKKQKKRKVPVKKSARAPIIKKEIIRSFSSMDVCDTATPQKQSKLNQTEFENTTDFQTESNDSDCIITNTESCKQSIQNNDPIASSESFAVSKALKITSMTTENIELVCDGFSEPLNLNYFWLRDHCRCSHCYSINTHQRKINILDIQEDVRPKKIVFQKKDVVITWDDDHESTYDLYHLRDMQQSVFLENFRNSSFITKQLWNNSEIQSHKYARVSLNDYLSSDNIAKELLASIMTYGIAFIENVPTNLPSTELAIKRLFAVQKTLFGEMYTLTDAKDHEDSAYSRDGLLAHNDNTYFNDPAGLQVMHCLEHTGSGGETILVDGFRAIKQLKKKNPDAFEWLCTANVPAEYIESGHYFKHYDPIIKLEPLTGEPLRIRFNLNDRAPLTTLPQQQMPYFYKSLRALASEIQSPENEWKFKLRPGTLAIFDNWRVLHGRTGYTGRRLLVGCYVSRNEFLSVVRTMGLLN